MGTGCLQAWYRHSTILQEILISIDRLKQTRATTARSPTNELQPSRTAWNVTRTLPRHARRFDVTWTFAFAFARRKAVNVSGIRVALV